MSTPPPTSTGFASRPLHAPLLARPCTAALMIADEAGASALLALAEATPELMPRTTVLLADAGVMNAALRARAPARLVETPLAGLEPALDALLAEARMGLQVHVAGSEGLIGRAVARLLAAGLPLGAIQSEHRGSPARRMQCVHCKTIAEDITTDPYTCPGCGRALYVREHFSRRLGAFQGVCINAETPGEVPEPVEIQS